MRTTAPLSALLLFVITHTAIAQESILRVTEIGDLTAVESRVWWAQPSADGRLLALQSGLFNRPGTTWLFDVRTRSLRKVDLPQADEVSLSPAGDRLVFTNWDTQHVWTAEVSDPSTTRRVSVQQGWTPLYSPDGDRIAYVAEVPCDPATGAEPLCGTILVIPSRGGEARRVGPLLRGNAWSVLSAWSPDGLWIYYRQRDADRFTWARVAATGGAPQTLFTRVGMRRRELGLSPDGRFIALGNDVGGHDATPELEIWSNDGERVLNERMPVGLNVFGWGHNNRLLGVQETRSEAIRWISTSGTAGAALSRSGEQETFPHWSPDGRRLAFKVGTSDKARPAVMNADGTGRRVYSDAPTVNVNASFPAWSPDGQWLAYRSWDTVPAKMGHVIVLEVSTGRSRSLGQTAGGVIAWRSDSRGVIAGDFVSFIAPPVVVSERLLDGSPPRALITKPSTFSGMAPLYDTPRGMGPTPQWFATESGELRTLRADGTQQVLLAGVGGLAVVSGDARQYAATVPGGQNRRLLVGGGGRAPVMVDLPGPLATLMPAAKVGYWHPDGSRFFVLAERPGNGSVGILSVSAAGGPAQWLPIPEVQDVTSFSLSADGNRIAYSTGEITRLTLVEIEVRGLSGR